jgi:hypothetical protein
VTLVAQPIDSYLFSVLVTTVSLFLLLATVLSVQDPFLSGSLAYSFVQGLQGDNPRYVRTNAGCKHLDVHGGPENIPVSSDSGCSTYRQLSV